MIIEQQRYSEHGAAIAEKLAKETCKPNSRESAVFRVGMSFYREFYLLYRDDERAQPLVAQIGWTHNLVIFRRCDGLRYLKQSSNKGATSFDLFKALLWTVSIHAPARGATISRHIQYAGCNVSIHAPARGATYRQI